MKYRLAFGAALVLVSAPLAVLFPFSALADLAAAPAPCATVETPFLTYTQNVINDPDSSDFDEGTWALDTFTENVSVWLGSDNSTYCANATVSNATFVTTGPNSPNAGVPLSAGVTGTFAGGENYVLPSSLTLNPAYSMTTVSNITLPDNNCGVDGSDCSGGAFSNWVSDAFTNPPDPLNSDVSTYWLQYLTPKNGNWIDSDPTSGGNDTGDIVGVPMPYAVTNDATSVTASDATLNGTNGDVAAEGESFWVSTATFSDSTPNIPANVYSTPILSGVAADAAFSDPLSLVTTNGIVTGNVSGNMPAINPGTTYYYEAWSEVDGTWYPGGIKTLMTSEAPPPPSTVTVTIDKYIDGKPATATSANNDSFPMQASWDATNIGSGSGTFSLGSTGFNSSNAYEAVTSEMTSGASYSVSEQTGGAVVGADCTTGDPYQLVGYTTGTTEEAAADATPTPTPPSLTDITNNEYVIVWNATCPPAPMVKVHILKYLNGVQATSSNVPGGYQFPMTSTWTASNLNSGVQTSGSYVLGDNYGGVADLYGADTSAMTAPADYTTSETVDDPSSQVVSSVDECSPGEYYLVGYSSGTSFADAATELVSTVAPVFTGLTADEYEIVWDATCPTTGSLTVNKDTNGGNGTFSFTGINGIGSFNITTSGGTGSETFNNLAPGPYTVTEAAAKGWTQVDSDCSSVLVTAGGNASCTITNTNNMLLGEIRGTKYIDEDGDGSLKDGDNHRLAGVTIYLDLNNDGRLDAGDPTTVTDKQGNYRFTSLPAGTYHVREVVQSGWTETYPSNDSWTVTLSAGQDAKNKNFGNFEYGSISGMKFDDLNGDHRKEKSDPGLSGWTIVLHKVGSNATQQTVTGTGGTFSFTNLSAGHYWLTEVQQNGWHQTVAPGFIWIKSGTTSTGDNFGNEAIPTHKSH